MAQKKGGKASEDPNELSRSPLQAILLADTFNLKFRPITLERPKVLLPLVNTPMIEYTLTWLESVGVEEVFVFCCSHAEQVKNYIKNSHWSKNSANFAIHTIESNFSISAGDALRFIEAKNVIRGDFILITGDTITNMNLTEALNLHRERRKKDPDTVMTMFVKRSKPLDLTRQTRLGNDEILMAVNPDTKQLLFYEDKCDSKRLVTIEKSLIGENPSLCLHNDLEDCYIDICSPEMLTILLDNFDYQHLRKHFVKGLLLDDIMGKKIYTHEIPAHYAARVDNFRSYDTVSRDVIQRWPFPLVPDVLCSGVRMHRQGVYKAPDVSLSPSCTIGPRSLIAAGTSVGDNSTISNSVVGANCKIGKNVAMEGCYVWDDVVIEDKCRLSHAVVCDGVVLRSGVVLEPGVILSFKVEVGQNIKIPAYSKVSLLPQPTKQDSDEELEYADSTTGVIDSPSIASISPRNVEHMHASFDTDQSGSHEPNISGVGFIWTSCETLPEEPWRYSTAPIPSEKLTELRVFAIARSDDASEDELQSGVAHSGEISLEAKSGGGFDSDGLEEEYRGDAAKFEKEVEETFERALGGVAEENVKLEINSLRLSYNVSHAECAGALFQSVIKSALVPSQSSAAILLKSTVEAIDKWKGLLCHFIKNVDEEIEVILKFEEMCMETTKEFSPIFSSVLHQLYDKDVISEEAVLSWESEKQGADESDKVFVKQSEPFLKWLKEAEEDDDDDE